MRFRLIATMFLTVLLGVTGIACSSEDDLTTAQPLTAFTSPVDGKTYCAWKENPHECPGPPGPPAAPFAMPDDEPHQTPGMSTTDFLLLMALFNWHTTYSPYYGSPGYYSHYVEPAWTRYPGTYYGAPGRTTIRSTTINNYTTVASGFDTRYAQQEKANTPKAQYKTAGGKTYKGTDVPTKAFSGTNVRVDKPAGDAPTAKRTGPGNTSKSSGGKSGTSTGKSGTSSGGGRK